MVTISAQSIYLFILACKCEFDGHYFRTMHVFNMIRHAYMAHAAVNCFEIPVQSDVLLFSPYLAASDFVFDHDWFSN